MSEQGNRKCSAQLGSGSGGVSREGEVLGQEKPFPVVSQVSSEESQEAESVGN